MERVDAFPLLSSLRRPPTSSSSTLAKPTFRSSSSSSSSSMPGRSTQGFLPPQEQTATVTITVVTTESDKTSSSIESSSIPTESVDTSTISLPSRSNSTLPQGGPPRRGSPPVEAILVPCMAAVIVILIFVIICLWRRWYKKRKATASDAHLESELPQHRQIIAPGGGPDFVHKASSPSSVIGSDTSGDVSSDISAARLVLPVVTIDDSAVTSSSSSNSGWPKKQSAGADEEGEEDEPSLPPMLEKRHTGSAPPSAPAEEKIPVSWSLRTTTNVSSTPKPSFDSMFGSDDSSASFTSSVGSGSSTAALVKDVHSHNWPGNRTNALSSAQAVSIASYDAHSPQRRQIGAQRTDASWVGSNGSVATSDPTFGIRTSPPPYEEVLPALPVRGALRGSPQQNHSPNSFTNSIPTQPPSNTSASTVLRYSPSAPPLPTFSYSHPTVSRPVPSAPHSLQPSVPAAALSQYTSTAREWSSHSPSQTTPRQAGFAGVVLSVPSPSPSSSLPTSTPSSSSSSANPSHPSSRPSTPPAHTRQQHHNHQYHYYHHHHPSLSDVPLSSGAAATAPQPNAIRGRSTAKPNSVALYDSDGHLDHAATAAAAARDVDDSGAYADELLRGAPSVSHELPMTAAMRRARGGVSVTERWVGDGGGGGSRTGGDDAHEGGARRWSRTAMPAWEVS
ncbi:hypothetical protein DFJ73DRAFT_947697 [Zopfochytrium polystomum]|nr:hypothetical protein DFJ73DRAFT_947697 [Zopfochytrium polystomum]